MYCGSVPEGTKVHQVKYFGIMGRAGSIRLALALGDVPFEDVVVTRDEWKELKPKTPWGGLPLVVTPDGTQIAQSMACLRYAAKIGNAKLYPADPILAAQVDSCIDAVTENGALIGATMRMSDEEKKVARPALVTGKVGERAKKFNAMLEKTGFLVGDSLTAADLALFSATCTQTSGLLDYFAKPMQEFLEKECPNI